MPRTQQIRRICAVGWSVGVFFPATGAPEGNTWLAVPKGTRRINQFATAPGGGGVGVQKPASCLLSPVSFFSDAISAVSVSNSTVSVANPAVSVTNKAESQLTSFQLPAPGGPQDARTNTPGFIHLTKT